MGAIAFTYFSATAAGIFCFAVAVRGQQDGQLDEHFQQCSVPLRGPSGGRTVSRLVGSFF